MPEPLQGAPWVICIQPRIDVTREKREAASKLVRVVPELMSGERLADFIASFDRAA